MPDAPDLQQLLQHPVSGVANLVLPTGGNRPRVIRAKHRQLGYRLWRERWRPLLVKGGSPPPTVGPDFGKGFAISQPHDGVDALRPLLEASPPAPCVAR